MNFIESAIPTVRLNSLPTYSTFYNPYKSNIIKLIDMVNFKYATIVSIIYVIARHSIIDNTTSSDQEKSRMYKGSFVVINGIAALIAHSRGFTLAAIGVSSVAALIGSLFLEMILKPLTADEDEDEIFSKSLSEEKENSKVSGTHSKSSDSSEAEKTTKNTKSKKS